MTNLLEKIAGWSLHQVSVWGYKGLFLTMMLESMAVPIPSEVIVPFGGFLASTGHFNFWLVAIVTTLANVAGAVILYFVGYYIGTAFLHRYGKYLLVHSDDIYKMDSWLQRYGGRVALISRLIPGTRTFSSVVIGASEVSFKTFFWYTLVGSFFWNLPWTYLGYKTGSNWQKFQPYIRQIDYLVIVTVLIFVAIYILRHFKKVSKKYDKTHYC